MGIHTSCKTEAARGMLGIHIYYKFGAVRPIYQMARARTRMGTHIHFHAKKY